MSQTSRSKSRPGAGLGAARVVGACLLAMGCGGMLMGCSAAKKPQPLTADNPNALQAFNEICNRALSEDLPFFREHLTPALTAQLGGDKEGPAADQAVKDFMGELQHCRGQSWKKAAEPRRAIVEVGRAQPAPVRMFSVDLAFDKEKGWLLASKLYGEQPLTEPPKPSK